MTANRQSPQEHCPPDRRVETLTKPRKAGSPTAVRLLPLGGVLLEDQVVFELGS